MICISIAIHILKRRSVKTIDPHYGLQARLRLKLRLRANR